MRLEKEVEHAATIGISGHIRPDGDCVGSCLALYLYLKKEYPDKTVEVFLEAPPEAFSCLPGVDQIKSDFETAVKTFDVFIATDTVKERLGAAEKYFDEAKATINIDHHISNSGCGDQNYIRPEASSTSELVYELLDETKLDADIASLLYIGIAHDTGVFRFSNTEPQTMAVASKLLAYGFDFSDLIEKTFYAKTYVQNLLLGRALMESILFLDGKCIVSSIELKTLRFYQADKKDLEGVVNQLNQTSGVECTIFMYQTAVMEYKVSMRSKGAVDVAAIAVLFGGGGHKRAAGCTMNGTFHDVVNNISQYIEKQLKTAARSKH